MTPLRRFKAWALPLCAACLLLSVWMLSHSLTGERLAGCAAGSGCDLDFPRTGFGFDLPEGMEITKGYFYPYDMGDVDYNSGVMMSWPVYADVPEDKYNELTDEEHLKLASRYLEEMEAQDA